MPQALLTNPHPRQTAFLIYRSIPLKVKRLLMMVGASTQVPHGKGSLHGKCRIFASAGDVPARGHADSEGLSGGFCVELPAAVEY